MLKLTIFNLEITIILLNIVKYRGDGKQKLLFRKGGKKRMEKYDLFKDIAERTKGDIYLGVVGPVRSGKSTFIKKFMELLVLPLIEDPFDKTRTKDELPQSGAGRTITTAEPKFIPNEAVEVKINDNLKLKVRIVDCVGYTVKGALGYEDEDGPRMVSTPWFEHEIPFQEAAELGTRKVISDHSTIGLVITTDGSIADISRENYIDAEERVIEELKEIGKPFAVVLNSACPTSEKAQEIKEIIESKYDVPVMAINCADMKQEDVLKILQELLYEFTVREININMPRWVEALDNEHWLKKGMFDMVKEVIPNVKRLRDVEASVDWFKEYDLIEDVILREMDAGQGLASLEMRVHNSLYYKVLSELTGTEINNDHNLISLLKELVIAKKEYDRIAHALDEVKETGYGIVAPQLDEMTLEEPEIIRQGYRFGVRLKASAPSIHMIKADIKTEIAPLVGTEKQSEELVNYLLNEFETDPKKIWESNIFGKSLYDLVREGIQNKLHHMPENAQMKLQETLQRIINEGSGGLICIIL
ncbi:MAG: stage sporulation protein [Thermosediminibacterales bacterium]|nr:stage sporulation protein [Thermosediminibacterales bacterium]MDK2836094.1 stage sporulation protein [Thermosediminibacterales bacterium]